MRCCSKKCLFEIVFKAKLWNDNLFEKEYYVFSKTAFNWETFDKFTKSFFFILNILNFQILVFDLKLKCLWKLCVVVKIILLFFIKLNLFFFCWHFQIKNLRIDIEHAFYRNYRVAKFVLLTNFFNHFNLLLPMFFWPSVYSSSLININNMNAKKHFSLRLRASSKQRIMH